MSLDLKVLFWNTYKNADINYVIAELVAENNISIVVLAEYIAEIDDLLKILLLQYGLKMRLYDNCCDRITIIGKIKDVEMRFDNSHATIQIVNGKDILCCTHLNSKIYSDHEAQREIYIEQLIREICNIEKDIHSENTIIVGDFNSINTYWNLYDQVIIRPVLRDRFVDDSLKIVTETQSRYLLDSKGHPDKSISDHLPIIFEIKEEN